MITGAAGVAAIIAVVFWSTMTTSGSRYLAPGELRAEHSKKVIPCARCHERFRGTPDAKCTACHKGVARQEAERRGVHGGVIGACPRCHVTHSGSGESIRVEADSVDHTLVGYGLSRHERQKCRDCHGATYKRKLIVGRCVNCHERFVPTPKGNTTGTVVWFTTDDFRRHEGSAGKDCLHCHVGGGKVEYKHKRRGFFTGRHDGGKCGRCHANDVYSQAPTDCAACHKPGHPPEFVQGCEDCHESNVWKPAKTGHKNTLQERHLRLNCLDCHKGGRWRGLPTSCLNCHQSPHRAAVSSDCLTCHNQERWSQTKMVHGSDRNCGGCHAVPAGHFAGACYKCHKTTRGWSATISHPRIPEHSVTSFPCDYCHPGGDAAVDCRRCHKTAYPKDD